MIFVDTNVLIYAHDVDATTKHEAAESMPQELLSFPCRGRSPGRGGTCRGGDGDVRFVGEGHTLYVKR
jgi:hypothetical protein